MIGGGNYWTFKRNSNSNKPPQQLGGFEEFDHKFNNDGGIRTKDGDAGIVNGNVKRRPVSFATETTDTEVDVPTDGEVEESDVESGPVYVYCLSLILIYTSADMHILVTGRMVIPGTVFSASQVPYNHKHYPNHNRAMLLRMPTLHRHQD